MLTHHHYSLAPSIIKEMKSVKTKLKVRANDDTGTSEESIVEAPLGRLILDDFWKGFQAYLDKLAWRETHLCVRPGVPFSFT